MAVDEAKKALFAGQSVKSFDFLVYSDHGPNLLVDVKGRKFPDSGRGPRRGTATRAWENWITRGDVEGLQEWEKVFGDGFLALLVFAYWLQGPPQRAPFADVHVYARRHYAFVGIPLADYVSGARPRSERWGTIAMPSVRFSESARDLAEFL